MTKEEELKRVLQNLLTYGNSEVLHLKQRAIMEAVKVLRKEVR